MPAERARLARAVTILGAIFVLFELIALSGIAPPPHAALRADSLNRFFGVALLTAFVFHLRARPSPAEIGVVLALTAVLRGGAASDHARTSLIDAATVIAMGVGEASLLVLAGKALRAKGEARSEGLTTLARAAVLPLFVSLTSTGLFLTSALHPATYDGAAFHLDAGLGGQASLALGRLFASATWLRVIAEIVYVALPLGLGVVYLIRERGGPRHPSDLFDAVLAAGLVGFALYHACPVAGPAYLFGPGFPHLASNLPIDRVPLTPHLLPHGVSRNGVPSLHTAWALLLFWHAQSRGPKLAAFGAAWLAITLLATLGLGEHYVVDLFIGVAFAVAVDAAVSSAVPLADPARLRPIVVGAGLTLAWILILRNAAPFMERQRGLTWALSIVTVALPLWLHRELGKRARAVAVTDAAATPAPEAELASPQRRLARTVAILFFCSGFSGLVYEVVFEKSLALTFGGTAQASATVLATYMGGMALGAWAGGRLGEKRRDALRIYALAELGIAIWCAISPLLFMSIRAAYLALATGVNPGSSVLVVVQAALGAIILLPATFLMGLTLPVLTRELLSAKGELGPAVSILYGANTLGAAAGAFLTGYFVLPFLGITFTTWLAVALNLLVALVGLRLAERRKASDPAAIAAEPEPLPEPASGSAMERRVALAILLGGGAITLALEVTYTHLLAVVAGNSVYAFSLMLFTFLVGLGVGSALIRPLLRRGAVSIAVVGALEIGLAVAILAGVFVWEGIPGYFGSFSAYSSATRFGQRELVRLLVCFVAMAPPSIAIGAIYPAALACASRGHPRGPIAAVGLASALNTAGNIAGALAGSFLLLPQLGSLRSLHALAALALALGLLPLLVTRARALVLIPATAALALFVAQPRRFDLDRLATGANVYFTEQGFGAVIDHAESVSGGITTVASHRAPDGDTILTLLTNGKFQGDDSPKNEMPAQFGFALAPLLHTPARGSALVIGFGTGGTARVMRDAGFARTDVVELAGDVLRLAEKHFRVVHDGVLSDPSVHTYVTDGRNFLLVQDRSYDLISLEVSSIWFAGAASLYNQEFYALAKKRLNKRGVLQQWIQLHHIAQSDIVSILATARAELPFVRLYVVGSQGIIVGCVEDCPVRPEHVAALDGSARLATVRSIYGGSVQRIADSGPLGPEAVDALIARWVGAGVPLEALISTDDNMLLEYNTPRGNVMAHWPSLHANLKMLGLGKPAAP